MCMGFRNFVILFADITQNWEKIVLLNMFNVQRFNGLHIDISSTHYQPKILLNYSHAFRMCIRQMCVVYPHNTFGITINPQRNTGNVSSRINFSEFTVRQWINLKWQNMNYNVRCQNIKLSSLMPISMQRRLQKPNWRKFYSLNCCQIQVPFLETLDC